MYLYCLGFQLCAACKSTLHGCPLYVPPLFNGSDFFSICIDVAHIIKINPGEGAGNGDRVHAGCGVRMGGVPRLSGFFRATVSPIYRVVVCACR